MRRQGHTAAGGPQHIGKGLEVALCGSGLIWIDRGSERSAHIGNTREERDDDDDWVHCWMWVDMR